MKIFSWIELQGFQSSTLVRQSYIWLVLLPVIARALENIGNRASLVILSHPFEIELSLPFSWVAFYLSAVFYAFGHFVYAIRAPLIVRENIGKHANFSMGSIESLDRYLFDIKLVKLVRKRIESVRRNHSGEE